MSEARHGRKFAKSSLRSQAGKPIPTTPAGRRQLVLKAGLNVGQANFGEAPVSPVGRNERLHRPGVGKRQAPHPGGVGGLDASRRVLDYQAFASLKVREPASALARVWVSLWARVLAWVLARDLAWGMASWGQLAQRRQRLQVDLGVGLAVLGVLGGDQYRELLPQPELPQQVLDLRPQAAAGDGERVLGGNGADEVHRAGLGRQSFADRLPVGASLPRYQLVAASGIDGTAVTGVKVLHDAAVVEGQVIAIIFLGAHLPPFARRHLLRDAHDEGLAIHEDAVEVEDDSAQHRAQGN